MQQEQDKPLWVQCNFDPHHFEGLLYVDASLAVFSGHFPGNPILPGIVQIDWAISVTERTFPNCPDTAFSRMSRIKFKSPIQPGAWLKLQLSLREDKVTFAYRNHQGACTEGVLHYHG